ncbi:MAG TPA: hypothetical protein VG269_17125 [Tepidisphaeraceae bacterium]|jgi:hypothetical protein|nr:hypothetical protein [Tepidisphaeraceae bacterium]
MQLTALEKASRRLSIMMLAIGWLAFPVLASADVTNGAFTDGNTGFSTAYTYAAADLFTVGGHYSVDSDPSHFNPTAKSFGDHTTGQGQMLLTDGSPVAGAQVWGQTMTGVPHTQYTFSYYSASWGTNGAGGITDQSPATLLATANGLQVGSTLQLLASDGVWSHFSGTFDSGSQSTIILEIQDLNTTFQGNDFAIDDISVLPAPEPAPVWMISLIPAALLRRRAR